MKTWSKKIPLFLGIWGWVLVAAWRASAADLGDAGAIQAIQQAPDPSAAVAAYANGVAVNRNDPKLYEAYVKRMVDLGLPELAYHQAQTLTTMDTNNGLAWAVVAYVDARRDEIPDAVSAINLAAQFAPDDPFVQRTAGGIVAWYDLKADKAKFPDSARTGMERTHTLLANRIAFTQEYDTAKKAYQSQAGATPPPGQPVQVPPTQPLEQQPYSYYPAVPGDYSQAALPPVY